MMQEVQENLDILNRLRSIGDVLGLMMWFQIMSPGFKLHTLDGEVRGPQIWCVHAFEEEPLCKQSEDLVEALYLAATELVLKRIVIQEDARYN